MSSCACAAVSDTTQAKHATSAALVNIIVERCPVMRALPRTRSVARNNVPCYKTMTLVQRLVNASGANCAACYGRCCLVSTDRGERPCAQAQSIQDHRASLAHESCKGGLDRTRGLGPALV